MGTPQHEPLFTDLLEADCLYDDDDDDLFLSSSSESDTSLPELCLLYRFRGGDDCFLLLQKKDIECEMVTKDCVRLNR